MKEMELPHLKFPWLMVPDNIFMTWIVMALLITLVIVATRRLRPVPGPLQNACEWLVEYSTKTLREVIGEQGPRYLPLLLTFFLFILVSNLIGLVPFFKSPTTDLNTTAALALVVFISYNYFGIKEQGARAYLSHFTGPLKSFPLWMLIALPPLIPVVIAVEVVGHFVRPVTLSIRLFGNIWGEDSVIATLFFLKWLVLPYGILMIFMFPLALLTSALQAYVFAMLSSIYIAGAVEAAHHDEH